MISTYVLDRVVETANPAYYRFIWNDGHEQMQPTDWNGFFRGVIGGWEANGEYERYDNELGQFRFGQIIVAEKFVEDGGVIEPYVPPAEPEE